MKIGVIGSGFSSLAAASVLAKQGHAVTIFEKNEAAGGRARQFEAAGFRFDMGPSWYWMPEVFESFYNRFGYTASDFYELVRLDPSYQVFFDKGHAVDIPADYGALRNYFESIEPGAARELDAFLEEAKYFYETGMTEYVWKPALSMFEFLTPKVLSGIFRLGLFSTLTKKVKSRFKDKRLIQLLEFPVLFLGAKPNKTPGMYSLMNYADIKLGTWYPMGGMHKIVQAFERIAQEQGVEFQFNAEVTEIQTRQNKATGLRVNGVDKPFDAVLAGADYHHAEQLISDSSLRSYNESYWSNRTLAPSSLLFYLGLSKEQKGLHHHNLFFDADFEIHASEIYDDKKWPSRPLFYVCCPSKTDDSVAPKGSENLFILMPIAAGLEDTPAMREEYFNRICERLSGHLGEDIRKNLVFKRDYCVKDFKEDYHALGGNAYGLANTLRQTAFLKPKMKSKRLDNLYFTGQLTTPGPGVPPSIISGQVVAELIARNQ